MSTSTNPSEIMDSLSSLNGNGLDLSAYKEELEKDRNTRSLNYRNKYNKPTIARFLLKQNPGHHAPLVSSKFPLLTPSNAIPILQEIDIPKIHEFCSNIMACHETGSVRLLNDLANSEEVIQAIIDLLSNTELPKQLLVNLMSSVSALFPINPEFHELYVDNGIIFSLLSFLSDTTPEQIMSSQEVHNLVGSTIELIGVLADNSQYARDSILSFGLHSILIDIARSEVSVELTYASCHCIQRICCRPEKIDSSVTDSLITPLSQLLILSDHNSIVAILTSFYALTSKCPSLILNFYDEDHPYFQVIVNMLQIEDLAAAALPLIGNLCNAHAPQVQKMLQMGLFETLMTLLNTKLVADVFWVLTSLVEAIPSIMISLISPEFINKSITTSAESSFDVKKEIVYFLCTLMLYTNGENLTMFAQPQLIDVLVEMLGCGVGMIVLRCLDVFQVFIINIEKGQLPHEFSELIAEESVIEQLEEMTDGAQQYVGPRAGYILSMIHRITESY